MYTIATKVVALDDHLAQIDANAELDPPVYWFISVTFGHVFLDFDGALDCIDDARELDEQTVAHGLDNAASAARDGRLDQFVKMGVETRASPPRPRP